MKKILINENLESVDRLITFPHEYVEGSIVLPNEYTYEVVDNKSILLQEGIDDGIYNVTYEHECGLDVKIISNIPKEKSLYKTYNSEDNLKENNFYRVVLDIDGNDFSKSFHSKLSPLYSNIDIIRRDTGDLLSDVPNIDIYLSIHENSIMAYNLANSENMVEEFTVTHAIRQYVRYRTDLDLVNAAYFSIVKMSGKVKKSVSTLDIEYDKKVPVLADMIEYFKGKVEEYEDEIKSDDSVIIASSFVRASGSAFPVDARNSF